MELYVPFRNESELFPEDFEECERKFRECHGDISYRKSKIMEYLQMVEEGRENAEEIISEETAEQLDAENVKDNSECADMEPSELDNFIAMDFVIVRFH